MTRTKKPLICLILAATFGCSSTDKGAKSAGNDGAGSGGSGAIGAGGASNAGAGNHGGAATSGAGGSAQSGQAGSGNAPSSGGSAGSAAVLGGSGGAGTAGSANSGGGRAGAATSGGAAGMSGSAAVGGAGAGIGGAATAGASGAGDVVDATTMAKAMGFGANIGNTFDNTTAWETGWGEPLVTQAYIGGMASRGIKTVRVPVAWNTYAVNGVIDPTKMDRVKEVVGWIEAAGMYAIVNIHWDGGWIDNDTDGNPNRYTLTDDVKTKFASYWTQIATAFASVDDKLVFEGLNEESKFYVNGDTSQAPDYGALNTLNQLFVTTVRAQSGYNKTRALLIAGFTTDIDLTCVDAFTVPTDPAGAGKLFLSIHYYTPYTFCGLDDVESWGSPQTTWGTDADESTLDGLFTKLGTFSTQRNIPVILGEFAVTVGTNYPRDPASRILWMETVARSSFSRGIVPVLWDTGSDISRTDGSFSTALQTVMTDLGQ
ncbi:MAG TPA: glycoside hydrolase family 5 protein [Polyangiaceae bacterium]|nr:glycoside hydrolase family 5 protein [Polyangiaceae bacterium]